MPGNYDLGTAKGTIELDASSLARATGALKATGLAFLGVGALALAGFGLAINKAATFEQIMSGAQSALGATNTQMEAVKKTALELGQNSVYGATNVGRAIEQLAYAGLSIQEITGGAAKATIDLAQASGGLISLDDAGRTVVNTMRTFGLGVQDTVHIADELAGAANKSTIDINDMVVAFKYVGPVAHTAGLGIDDVAQGLAILGDRGIRGSTAGTSLRGVLLGLVAPSVKASKELKALGIIQEDGTNIMFDQTGKMKSLSEVSQILQDHTAGLSREQKIAAFNAIFQRRALASALVLSEQGSKGFEHYRKEIAAGGSAADIAAVRLDNLKGDMALLKSQVETVLIKAGTPFQNMLRTWVQGITGLIRAFGSLSPGMQTFLVGLLGVVGALFTAAGAAAIFASSLLKMYKVFRDLGPAIEAVTGIFTAMSEVLLANPVFLIIAAIVVLIAILVLLIIKVKPVREFFISAWKDISGAFVAAWNYIYPIIVSFIQWMGENIPRAARAVWAAIQSAWGAIQRAFSTAWGVMQPIIQAIADFFVRSAQTAADWGRAIGRQAELFGRYFNKNVMPTVRAFGELFAAIFNRVSSIVQLTWQGIQPVLNFFLDVFRIYFKVAFTIARAEVEALMTVLRIMGQFLSVTFQAIVGLLQAVWIPAWIAIRAAVDIAFQVIKSAFDIFVAVIKTIWSPFWTFLRKTVQNIWATIKEIIDAAMQIIRGILEVATGLITGKWGKAWDGIKNILAGAWDLIVGLVRGAINNLVIIIQTGIALIINFFKNMPGAIFKAVINIGTLLVTKGDELIRGFFRGLLDAWQTVWEWFTKLPSLILDLLKDFGTLLFDVGKALLSGLLDGIKAGLGDVKDFVTGIGSKLISWKGPPSVDKVLLTENGELIMSGLVRGLQGGLPAVQGFLGDVTQLIQSTQPALQSQFTAAGGGTGRGFQLPSGVNTSNGGQQTPIIIEKGDTVHVEAHQTNADPHEIVDAYFWAKRIRR